MPTTTRPPQTLEQQERKARFLKFDKLFYRLSEACNISILLKIIGSWIPIFGTLIATGPLAYFIFISDPLIYFFKALKRLTRLIGRNQQVEFEEEKNGKPHQWQTAADILTLVLSLSVVALFTIAVSLSLPGLTTLGWAIGICSLGIVTYFDYWWPEKLAHKKYIEAQEDSPHDKEQLNLLEKEYENLRFERQANLGTVISVALLLICGSAAVFAPPLLADVLLITSKIASIALGFLGCARLYHAYSTEEEILPAATLTLAPVGTTDGVVFVSLTDNPPLPAPALPPPSNTASSQPIVLSKKAPPLLFLSKPLPTGNDGEFLDPNASVQKQQYSPKSS